MVDNSNIAHLDDYQRNAVLTFDEMKIRNDFVYHLVNWFGSTELDSLNGEYI